VELMCDGAKVGGAEVVGFAKVVEVESGHHGTFTAGGGGNYFADV